MKLRPTLALLALLSGAATLPVHAFTVIPGTLIGLESSGTGQLREYSFGGTLLDTLTITGLTGTPSGIAVIGTRVFVMDSIGNVGEVNVGSGVVSGIFSSLGNEALGDNGTNLLAYNYNTGVVRTYTPAGVLQGTATMSSGTGGTGIDGSGARIFLGQYDNNGNIREFTSGGALVNTVATGLPSGSVSGLGYYVTDNSYWVSTGFGDDMIYHFSATGTKLGSFAAGSSGLNDIDIVAIPEPASMGLLLAGGGLLGIVRRRRA